MNFLRRTYRNAPVFFSAIFLTLRVYADCSLTNINIAPLNEMGLGSYAGFGGGLYPGGVNSRPAAHEAAGIAIAQGIQPLDAAGNVNTNTGKIGLLSIGMSNVTQEWATKGTNAFYHIAINDPSLNPHVTIADGGISGQDATRWTNASSTNWAWVATNRLAVVGLSTNQVQVMWLKQALQKVSDHGAFPLHAQKLQAMEEQIIRNAKASFPNLKIAYLASRTRAYTAISSDSNPEPFAFESGFATRWVIQDQINVTNNLNYNPSNGPVVAPWLSWGPYLWANGTVPRGDGMVSECSDLESDYMHPTTNGHVAKVAVQLLSFFKTDPTATPWFLKTNSPGGPVCAPTGSPALGFIPLTVNFSANASPGSAPLRDYQWTFGDGEFATNANPVKIFRTPGSYRARLTVTDTNGNTTRRSVNINASAKYSHWASLKFTPAEYADTNISGAFANPDSDFLPNLLEYAMGSDPKTNTSDGVFSLSISNGFFSLTYPHYKYATDAPLTLESSPDLSAWSSVTVTQSLDLGSIEFLSMQQAVTNTAKFYRLNAVLY